MVTLSDVRNLAEVCGIRVEYVDLPKDMNGVAVWHPGRRPGIGLDNSLWDDPIKHKCIMAHEIGHIMTAEGNGIPRLSTPYYYRCLATKVEHKGKLWTARYLIPYRELAYIMSSGCREVWQLCEHFEVLKEIVWSRFNMTDALKLKQASRIPVDDRKELITV